MSINDNYLRVMKNIVWDNQIDNFEKSLLLPLKKSIKINVSKINIEKFTNLTKDKFWKLSWSNLNIEWSENDIYYVDRDDTSIPLWKTFFHQSWFFYIQEIAAWTASRNLDIAEDDLVLDISSSPWWKTCQIADYLLTENIIKPWFVVSNDVDWKRLKALSHNINRMWYYNTWISKINWFSFWKNLWEIFDKVLVDAPCSWEWTCFKSDSALKFWRKEEINKICWTQFQLLVSAIKSTKPWWTIVYSTCTLNPYENEMNVKRILEFYKENLVLENINISNKSHWITNIDWESFLNEEDAKKVARFRPHIQKTWWFFIAKFKKTKSLWEKFLPKNNTLVPKNQFKIDCSKNIQNKIKDFLLSNYWIQINDWILFVSTKNQVYITSKKFLEVKDKIWFERIWIPILKINNNWEFRILHSLWVILWNLATKNFIELDYEWTQEYSDNKDISTSKIIWWKYEKWYVIIKFKEYWISVWKIIDDYIKNKYIR